MPTEDIALDLILGRQSVTAAGMIWQKRRVVVSHDSIKFGKPRQNLVLDYVPLVDVKSVESYPSLRALQKAMLQDDESPTRGWIYIKGQVSCAHMSPHPSLLQ